MPAEIMPAEIRYRIACPSGCAWDAIALEGSSPLAQLRTAQRGGVTLYRCPRCLTLWEEQAYSLHEKIKPPPKPPVRAKVLKINAENVRAVYAGTIELVSNTELKLKGCVVAPLCKTQKWTRIR